jgi:hypothetical protein
LCWSPFPRRTALYTEDAIDEHTVDAVIQMAWPAIAAAATPAR